MESKWAIGIDIGGTKIEVSHVDANGIICDRQLFPSDVLGGPAAIELDIVHAVQKLMKNALTSPLGIGVGMAGQINPLNGLVYFAPNLQWHNVPLQEDLEYALKLPTVVINDVRAATWGEWSHGAGRGCQDLVCIFVGTGIGGGIVSGGKLLVGSSNTAGELGHLTIDIYGPLCTCGNRGCFEAISGGWGIGKTAQEAIAENPQEGKMLLTLTGKPDLVTAKQVIEAYHKGDSLARKIMEKATLGLIAGCTSIINAFNPSKLILGGGIMSGMPELLSTIEIGVRKSALKAATMNLELVAAQLPHNDANLIGAATYAMQYFK